MAQAYFEAQDDPVAVRAAVDAAHPLGRMGQPGEIAAAFLCLASEEARWVTGTALVIDGGLTAGLSDARVTPFPRAELFRPRDAPQAVWIRR